MLLFVFEMYGVKGKHHQDKNHKTQEEEKIEEQTNHIIYKSLIWTSKFSEAGMNKQVTIFS